jgi:hypothetical protein
MFDKVMKCSPVQEKRENTIREWLPPRMRTRQCSRLKSTLGRRRGRSKEVYLERRPMSEVGQSRKYSLRANVFRCSPNNGHTATTATRPSCANNGLMRKQHLYSITASARATNVGGNSRPTALAVLRMDQSRVYDATASAQLAFPRSTKDRRWNTKRLPIAARLRPRTSRFDPSPRAR